ncbi:hypothetical protein EML15_04555 [Corynebacterium sp. sy017]|uniref:alpha/beta hydrolase n=1 Tax=unclassified Corynebacterium TaxID=2624378 RepID=UPI0011855765|nr:MULTISPECIES: alpha/beta hydrolase [unclassified Corynebacterium]MBP3088417.1 hypothetical protein [Corynebacterium sp. sy017]TSD91728.1 hypothetical protein ELY17_04555 [Corynebacterium sp. SY003]
MSIFPLKSSELSYTSAHHKNVALRYEQLLQAQKSNVDTAFATVSSIAFDAAQQRFYEILTRWHKIHTTTLCIINALDHTASAQSKLEETYKQILSLYDIAQGIADCSLPLTIALNQLQTLGKILDFCCANTLRNRAREPEHSLSERKELNLDELHELSLIEAPENIISLSKKFPDAHILEADQKGHVTLAFGDIDNAKSITTIVAGVGSSSSEGMQTYSNRAQHIYQKTGTPVVMWLGYDAPPSLAAGIAKTPALQARIPLQKLQKALRERNPHARLVVLGHSYGSTVAGYAATESGLEADSLILAGSPGVPRKLTLNSQSPKIIAALGDKDPIGLTGTALTSLHGIDPAALTSGYPLLRIHGGHSDYFTDESFIAMLKKELNKPKG